MSSLIGILAIILELCTSSGSLSSKFHVVFCLQSAKYPCPIQQVTRQFSTTLPHFQPYLGITSIMVSLGRRIKNHCVAFLGEFVGTFLFLFFAFAGTQTANTPSSQETDLKGPDLTQLLYISLIFGFSLAVNVWVFFRISGGLFNPAVNSP